MKKVLVEAPTIMQCNTCNATWNSSDIRSCNCEYQEPEAPTEGCDEHKRFLPHCEDCIAPKPAKDALVEHMQALDSLSVRGWPANAIIAYEKLERGLAEERKENKRLSEIVDDAGELENTLRVKLAEAEEMLEMADAAKNELCDGYKEDLTQEHAKSAESRAVFQKHITDKSNALDLTKFNLRHEKLKSVALVEALELLADPNWDGSFCDVETIAREALEKYKKS